MFLDCRDRASGLEPNGDTYQRGGRVGDHGYQHHLDHPQQPPQPALASQQHLRAGSPGQ